ncbi:hypothetical protein ACJX0J_015963 [Zea mays]
MNFIYSTCGHVIIFTGKRKIASLFNISITTTYYLKIRGLTSLFWRNNRGLTSLFWINNRSDVAPPYPKILLFRYRTNLLASSSTHSHVEIYGYMRFGDGSCFPSFCVVFWHVSKVQFVYTLDINFNKIWKNMNISNICIPFLLNSC